MTLSVNVTAPRVWNVGGMQNLSALTVTNDRGNEPNLKRVALVRQFATFGLIFLPPGKAAVRLE